jgi:cysteine desulfurase
VPPIYLDNNATTRPLPAVTEAVTDALAEHWHNPSSIHRPGQAARQRVDLARKHLAALIGARPRTITLCGSGTEAIDLAIRGALLAQGRLGARRTCGPGTIITTRAEHVAVRELAAALEREEGVRALWAEFDERGVVRADSVAALLEANADVALVSVQWASNETGAVNPVHEIAALCRARGVLFHTDATQWVGKMEAWVGSDGVTESRSDEVEGTPRSASGTGSETWSLRHSVTPSLLPCDLLSFSSHKFHGPKGVGVLYCRPGVRTAPLIHGEQELGRRGGTENVPGIAGAGSAARLALEWLADPAGRAGVAALRDRFERAVVEGVPDAVVNGPREGPGEPPGTRRLWNTTSIGFPRLEAEGLLLLLSERGVCASAGAACSSGSLEPSPVLRAMGVPPEIAHGTVRFSLSRETTRAEVDEAAAIVVGCVRRLRGSMAGLVREPGA